MQNSEVNLPSTTFLRDADITMFGGTVTGIENVEISLNGGFHLYPEARIYSDVRSVVNLNLIEVMDGGVFSYRGVAADGDALTLSVAMSSFRIVPVPGPRIWTSRPAAARSVRTRLKVSSSSTTSSPATWTATV